MVNTTKKRTAKKKQLEYINQYNKKTYTQFVIKVRTDSEQELITYVKKQPSIQGYFVGLAKDDMKKKGNND